MAKKWASSLLLAGAAFAGAAAAQDQAPISLHSPQNKPTASPVTGDRAACFLQGEWERKEADPEHAERLEHCIRGADALALIKVGRMAEAMDMMQKPPRPAPAAQP